MRASWISRDVSDESSDKVWKQISNYSERQFGAFVFAYSIDTNQPPPVLTQKCVEFRNAVIHKGKFPTREEAIKFGEEVAAVAQEILSRLKNERCKDAVQQLILRRLRLGYAAAEAAGARASTHGQTTLFSLNGDGGSIDVRGGLERREKRPYFELTFKAAALAASLMNNAKNSS